MIAPKWDYHNAKSIVKRKEEKNTEVFCFIIGLHEFE